MSETSRWLTGPSAGRWATTETSWSLRGTVTAVKASCSRASPCLPWWGGAPLSHPDTKCLSEVTWRRVEAELSSCFLLLTDHGWSEAHAVRAGEVWGPAGGNRLGGGHRVGSVWLRWLCHCTVWTISNTECLSPTRVSDINQFSSIDTFPTWRDVSDTWFLKFLTFLPRRTWTEEDRVGLRN